MSTGTGSRARLSDATLKEATGVLLPAYDRGSVAPGVVHLGVGAFHRAHQAVYLDDCLAAGETEWGIVGASLRSTDTRDALAPQDGLYTVAVQDSAGEQLRVVGALKELLVAPENPSALVDHMADPRTRIVTLTVTEKAYLRDSKGQLDLANPDLAWDIANPERPRTVYGFLAAALARRSSSGAPPFTVLCCDNLPANGETVRRLMLQFAEARDRTLAGYIEGEARFPSTMVDRIVPATTEEDRERISAVLGLDDAWPVKTEPFMQWVVEDAFTLGRPDWERFGVTMVKSVQPFEEMKLRLLNGAHSGLSYLGLLCGRESVSAAFLDPVIRGFVDRLWSESKATLPGGHGLDPDAYTQALSDRFANTALVHRTAQIAMDGSQKLPQRIIAASREQLQADRPAVHLSLAVAAWIACCGERGRSLPAALFTDPLDNELGVIFARAAPPPETVAAIFQAAGFAVAAGPAAEALQALVSGHLDRIQRLRAADAIRFAASMGTRE